MRSAGGPHECGGSRSRAFDEIDGWINRSQLTAGFSLVAVIVTVGVLRAVDGESGDSGPAEQVVEIKAALPVLLQKDVSTGRLPDLPTSRRTAWAHEAVDKRRLFGALKDVWLSSVLPRRVNEWATAIRVVSQDSSYPGYEDNTLTVTEWQTVRVEGDRATAAFLGHPSYLRSNGWVADEEDEYHVVLARVDARGSWRLVTVKRINVGDMG